MTEGGDVSAGRRATGIKGKRAPVDSNLSVVTYRPASIGAREVLRRVVGLNKQEAEVECAGEEVMSLIESDKVVFPLKF